MATAPDPREGGELDLKIDVVELAKHLCDIPSVSGDEKAIADAVENALAKCDHLEVSRDENAIVASTSLGRPRRVVLAGHLDTVPIDGNLPSWIEGDALHGALWGRGSVDMKGGVAIQLRLAQHIKQPENDITYIFYDQEELTGSRNGLGRLARTHPEWLAGDFAVLCEPTGGGVEAGCQGSLQLEIVEEGIAAHSARPWTGRNAIHEASTVLNILREYEPRQPEIDGLHFRESINAVGISGGIAMNVIPDSCVIRINYRFAPDRSIPDAQDHIRDVFFGHDVRFIDALPGALPNLGDPRVAEFCNVVRGQIAPKLGWTDVARFGAMGIPAVNFGPGDPLLAHTRGERCPVWMIRNVEAALAAWLGYDPEGNPG